MQFLSYLINGISLGSVYALIALGYTMVYGIAKMLNFAHGDVIMIGSYVIFFAFGSFGLNPIVSVLLSMVVCTILGITMERVAYRPLREAPSLAVLITAIGVSYLLQQVAQLLWTSNPKNFKSVVSLQPIKLFDGQLTSQPKRWSPSWPASSSWLCSPCSSTTLPPVTLCWLCPRTAVLPS